MICSPNAQAFAREVIADKISFLGILLTGVPAVWICLSTALSYSLAMERKNPDVLSYSLLILGLCDLCKKVDQQSKL